MTECRTLYGIYCIWGRCIVIKVDIVVKDPSFKVIHVGLIHINVLAPFSGVLTSLCRTLMKNVVPYQAGILLWIG